MCDSCGSSYFLFKKNQFDIILFHYFWCPESQKFESKISKKSSIKFVIRSSQWHNLTRAFKFRMIPVQAGRPLKSESPIGGKSPFHHCFQLTYIILNQKTCFFTSTPTGIVHPKHCLAVDRTDKKTNCVVAAFPA